MGKIKMRYNQIQDFVEVIVVAYLLSEYQESKSLSFVLFKVVCLVSVGTFGVIHNIKKIQRIQSTYRDQGAFHSAV